MTSGADRHGAACFLSQDSAAGIGFTVALFVASVAFEAGEVQSAAKLGALASCVAAGAALAAARALAVRRK